MYIINYPDDGDDDDDHDDDDHDCRLLRRLTSARYGIGAAIKYS